jgi:hypothetical protein
MVQSRSGWLFAPLDPQRHSRLLQDIPCINRIRYTRHDRAQQRRLVLHKLMQKPVFNVVVM